MVTVIEIIKWAMPAVLVIAFIYFYMTMGSETSKKKWIGTVQEISKTFLRDRDYARHDTFEITLHIESDEGKFFTYSFLEDDDEGTLPGVKVGDRLIKRETKEYPEFAKGKNRKKAFN